MEGYEVLRWQTVPAEPSAVVVPDEFNMAAVLVDRHLQEGRGERIAIYAGDRQLTYWELAALVNRTGNGLASLGLATGDRVVLLLADSPEFLATFLGAMKIGAVPVPINVLATTEDLIYYLNDSRARAVVTGVDCLQRLEDAAPQLRYLRHVILVGDGEHPHAHSFARLVEGQSVELAAAATTKDDPAYWLYSSGTTGRPKGVVHLHQDMVYCTQAYAHHVVALTVDDVSYSASKLFFSYGLVNSLYLPLWSGGAVVLSPDRPEPATILATIERYRPTLFYSVPTSYGQIIRELENREPRPDLGSLRLCVSAGEALPAPLCTRWRELTGVEILDGVGSTEVGYIFLSNRPGRSRPGASGEIIPGYQARLVDEDGQQVPAGEVGDLWVCGRSTAARYWNQHERSKATFVGDWMKTGDKYYRDDDGYYVYSGRSDDMLKVSGLWVSPMEVEAALLSHAAVAEAAVVGALDDAGLIKPRAFVVLHEAEPSPELGLELQDWVKGHLAPYKYPRTVEFVTELPKTATGKIQRYRLR